MRQFVDDDADVRFFRPGAFSEDASLVSENRSEALTKLFEVRRFANMSRLGSIMVGLRPH